MSKIQIDLPDDVTRELKILAALADRSLTRFLPLYLTEAVHRRIITVDKDTRNILISSASQFNSYQKSQAQVQVQVQDQDQMIANIVKSGGIVRMPKLSKAEQEDKDFHEKIETQTHLEREKNLYEIVNTFKVHPGDDTLVTLQASGMIFDLIENDFDKSHTLEEIRAYMKDLHDRYYSE